MTDAPQPAGFSARIKRLVADRELRTKVIKFASIGLVNSGVDYAIFAFGYLYLGLRPITANALAWIIANTGSYVMNSFFTFAAESGRVLRLKDYLGFVASGLAGFFANTATVILGSFFMPVMVAKIFAIGVSFVVNFLLSHFVVFPARRAEDPSKR